MNRAARAFRGLPPTIALVFACSVTLAFACSGNNTGTDSSAQPLMSVPPATLGSVSVLTQHNINARSGVNPAESVLTPRNVNNSNFGELWRLPVDGQVGAQPLYVGDYTGIGKPTRNVLIVATLNNTVYAFDADSSNPTPIWTSHLHAPNIPSGTSGDAIVNNKPTGHNPATIGILSTPVIDPTKTVSGKTPGVIYYVEMYQNGLTEDFILNEISLDDGTLTHTPLCHSLRSPA